MNMYFTIGKKTTQNTLFATKLILSIEK